jgi:hypothetical protein
MVLAAPALARAQEAAGAPITSTGAGTDVAVSSDYDRGHNTGVQDTPRPAYEALGLPLGAFMVYPKISLTGTYDDNVFALPTHKEGDFSFDVAPELDLQSTWSRNALSAYVRVDEDAYARLTSQDTTQYGAGVAGKLELGSEYNNTAGLDFGHFTLPQNVANNFGLASTPIEYNYTAFNDTITAKYNRIRLSLRFDDQDFQYQNAETAGGATVFVEDQSHNDEILTGRVEFALSPDTALDVEAQGNHRGYGAGSLTTPTFSSSGYQINGGANFDITHLIRGEFQLGYFSQSYVAAAFRPVQGLSANARVEWFPTQLTTVTFTAARENDPSQSFDSAGFVDSRVALNVDHELLRNLILSGNLNVAYNQYVGVDRNDTLYGGGVSASWLITRHVGVKFAYAYTDQRSIGTQLGTSFTDNRGTLSLVLQY